MNLRANFVPRPSSVRLVLMGAGVLALCTAFFAIDVVVDLWHRADRGIGYSSAEAIHLVFEVAAVLGLGFGALNLWSYFHFLKAEARRSEQTLNMLRGQFDEVLHARFNEWGLTPAEKDVALFMIRGLTNEEIAAARNTASGTIKAQSTSIFRKVGVRSKPELMSTIIDHFLDQSAGSSPRGDADIRNEQIAQPDNH